MRPLVSGFERSVERCGSRPALEAAGQTLTYAELGERAGSIAAAIQQAGDEGPALAGVLADRTPTAFAGVLGALLAGRGYVPLNPTFPIERTRTMIERSGARTIVCDAAGAAQLEQVLAGLDARTIVLPDADAPTPPADWPGGHRVIAAGELPASDARRVPDADPQALAYLMFTSGSTGTPKGVMVTNANARHYVDNVVERYDPDEHDRFSQTAELTFDNSVLDLFCAWERGACVCCPDRRTLIKPGSWIRERELTVWFSVPSTAIFMRRFGQLKPGSYPSLRWSLFAGEALPLELAEAWLLAAPNSTVENLFGPTEATDVCLIHRFDPLTSPAQSEQGTVPIGHPLPGMSALIADDGLVEVAPGEVGELLICGPQVALGYWQDPERTAQAFVVPPGRDAVHYRTGDRARRPADPGGVVTYLGRRDHQVQIFGERIELGEVEAALRDASGVDAVAAIGWPVTAAGVSGIEAFVAGDVDADAIRAALQATLLGRMVPRRIHVVPELPLNANGKVDRAVLTAWLEDPVEPPASERAR